MLALTAVSCGHHPSVSQEEIACVRDFIRTSWDAYTIIPGLIGIFKSIGITSATIPESPFDRMPEMLVKQSYRYRFATSRIPFVT